MTIVPGVLNRLIGGAVRWLHQRWCALRGHAMAVRCEPGRMSLVCMGCGVTTSGWTLALEPPRPARTIAVTRGATVVPIAGARRRRTGRAARPRAA